MADPHAVIRQYMRAVVQGDNMPISLGRGTREKLAAVWGELGYKNVAEVGVKAAEFSVTILVANPNCLLHCIDPWRAFLYSRQDDAQQEQYLAEAKQRLAKFPGRHMLHQLTSMEALPLFADGQLDAVFIDGDHTFDHACPDIIYWSKKVRSGGMIAVHDYCHLRRSGVMKAVDAYTHCHDIRPWYVTRESLPTAFWVKP